MPYSWYWRKCLQSWDESLPGWLRAGPVVRPGRAAAADAVLLEAVLEAEDTPLRDLAGPGVR